MSGYSTVERPAQCRRGTAGPRPRGCILEGSLERGAVNSMSKADIGGGGGDGLGISIRMAAAKACGCRAGGVFEERWLVHCGECAARTESQGG